MTNFFDKPATLLASFFVLAAVGLPQSVRAESLDQFHQMAQAPGGNSAQVPLLTENIRMITGPKRTVAVGKFDAIGAFTAKYGQWDIGGGLSAMMTSALVESNRFIVLERANLSQILTEQELRAGGLTAPGTGPQAGNLAGVQLMIYGAVTEFGASDSGGGFSIGASGGSLGSLLGGALSTQSKSGSVGLDVRVVNTTTGQVMKTHRVRKSITASGFDVSLGYRGISLGTNEFVKTPLGRATREAVTEAVQLIAQDAGRTPWTGRVVDVSGREIYINAGQRSGIRSGDTFMVERVTKRLTDPSTGELLGIRKTELGVLQLTGIEEKLSYGSYSPLASDPPQRGDMVVIMAK